MLKTYFNFRQGAPHEQIRLSRIDLEFIRRNKSGELSGLVISPRWGRTLSVNPNFLGAFNLNDLAIMNGDLHHAEANAFHLFFYGLDPV